MGLRVSPHPHGVRRALDQPLELRRDRRLRGVASDLVRGEPVGRVEPVTPR
ncbi:MAG: hypothetical protein JRE18_02635 [Deltaproteobacteria bacterium]|nr:hypothetical protein [Deltaproteobacteria bacterium]